MPGNPRSSRTRSGWVAPMVSMPDMASPASPITSNRPERVSATRPLTVTVDYTSTGGAQLEMRLYDTANNLVDTESLPVNNSGAT